MRYPGMDLMELMVREQLSSCGCVRSSSRYGFVWVLAFEQEIGHDLRVPVLKRTKMKEDGS